MNFDQYLDRMRKKEETELQTMINVQCKVNCCG